MHKSLGITVVLVSHSMDDAARLCQRIFVMNQGQIVLSGTPSEVFSQGEMLVDIGLDIPQISKLMTELNKIEPDISAGIFTLEEATGALLDLAKKRGMEVKPG